jgi:excisionase family DNA binding protein
MAKTQRPKQVAYLDTADRLMSINEVAEYLHVHRATVYRLMEAGALPYRTVNTRRRIRMSDVVAYLDVAS